MKTKRKRPRKVLDWYCQDCKQPQSTTISDRKSRFRIRCTKCGGLLVAKRFLVP